jgi:hypothetical protein
MQEKKEDRIQKTEFRRQNSEDRIQNSEGRRWKPALSNSPE